jgi:hypothetical protein
MGIECKVKGCGMECDNSEEYVRHMGTYHSKDPVAGSVNGASCSVMVTNVPRKHCSRCGLEKKVTEFYKRKKGRNGVASLCKDCIRKYQKNYKKTHPKKEKKEMVIKEEIIVKKLEEPIREIIQPIAEGIPKKQWVSFCPTCKTAWLSEGPIKICPKRCQSTLIIGVAVRRLKVEIEDVIL